MKQHHLRYLIPLLIVAAVVAWFAVVERGPSYQGRPVSYWVVELKTKQFTTVTNNGRRVSPAVEAEKALRAIGAPALPRLLAAVQREESWWQRACRLTCANLPPEIRQRLPLPIPFENRSEGLFRARVVDMGRQAAPESLPVLLKASSSRRPVVRAAAVGALHGITNGPPEVLATLIRSARDPDPEVRWHAFIALNRFGAMASNAVPAAIEALQEDELGDARVGFVRSQAATLLGTLGSAANVAIPVLEVTAAQKTNSVLRVDSAVALWRIRQRTADVLPVLLEVFEQSETGRKPDLLAYLRELRTEAAPAVPLLVALAKTTDVANADNRQLAIELLQTLDPEAAKRVGPLAPTTVFSLDRPLLFDLPRNASEPGAETGRPLIQSVFPVSPLGLELKRP